MNDATGPQITGSRPTYTLPVGITAAQAAAVPLPAVAANAQLRTAEAGATEAPVQAGAVQRRALADRITEDVLQLLFTAHQDLAELHAQGPSIDGQLLQSAQECTLGAISVLRVVATAVREMGATSTTWGTTAAALFDAMTDAWVVTCEASDLLFASETACALLGHTPAELSALMRKKDGWPRTIRTIPRAVGASGETHFDLDIPLKDGAIREVHVQSHPLPLVQGVRRSYISLLTPRDA